MIVLAWIAGVFLALWLIGSACTACFMAGTILARNEIMMQSRRLLARTGAVAEFLRPLPGADTVTIPSSVAWNVLAMLEQAGLIAYLARKQP